MIQYNIEDHLNTLPEECKFITDEIKYSTWKNAVENNLIKNNTYEEDYEYDIVCIMRKKENKVEREN